MAASQQKTHGSTVQVWSPQKGDESHKLLIMTKVHVIMYVFAKYILRNKKLLDEKIITKCFKSGAKKSFVQRRHPAGTLCGEQQSCRRGKHGGTKGAPRTDKK